VEVCAHADFAGAHLRDDRADRSVRPFMEFQDILSSLDAEPVEVPAVLRLFP